MDKSLKPQHKDTLFRALFKDTTHFLHLLAQCNPRAATLTPDDLIPFDLESDVARRVRRNDVSFLTRDNRLIILVEHQTTINPNMALRLLLYITRVLEKRIESRTLYSKKQLTIPWPEFFVLYNGKEPYPDQAIVRLSDLFAKPQELGLPEKMRPLLELEVRVININEGKNEAIANRCKKLAEYSAFVAKAHTFIQALGNKEDGIKAAITYCQKHAILNEFLEIHGSEILNMILTEWNMEDALAFAREESWEDGLTEGLNKGLAKGETKGKADATLEIARNLKKMGIPMEQIIESTRLSFEAIDQL